MVEFKVMGPSQQTIRVMWGLFFSKEDHQGSSESQHITDLLTLLNISLDSAHKSQNIDMQVCVCIMYFMYTLHTHNEIIISPNPTL